MELTRAICTTCGYPLEVDLNTNTATCDKCQNTYYVKHAVALKNKTEHDIKELRINREQLKRAVLVNDLLSIEKYSIKVISLIPKDYIGNYFYAYAKSKLITPKYIYDFYKNDSIESTKEELNTVLHHMIAHSELRDYDKVLSYIERFDQGLVNYYQIQFEKRKQLENNYANYERDIFISYRSTEEVIATNLVDVLEKDGYTCWISKRNLRPNDNQNYWDNIREAIDNCNIFLVVSSNDAMLSKDVQKEIDYARKQNINKLEFKIDDTPHTTLFKHFFDGIKWIDASKNLEDGYCELKKRLYHYNSNSDMMIKNNNKENQDSKTKQELKWDNFLIKHHFDPTTFDDLFLQVDNYVILHKLLHSYDFKEMSDKITYENITKKYKAKLSYLEMKYNEMNHLKNEKRLSDMKNICKELTILMRDNQFDKAKTYLDELRKLDKKGNNYAKYQFLITYHFEDFEETQLYVNNVSRIHKSKTILESSEFKLLKEYPVYYNDIIKIETIFKEHYQRYVTNEE